MFDKTFTDQLLAVMKPVLDEQARLRKVSDICALTVGLLISNDKQQLYSAIERAIDMYEYTAKRLEK